MDIKNENNVAEVPVTPLSKKLEAEGRFVNYVRTKFQIARDGKLQTMSRALEAYKAWRGELSNEELESIAKIEAKSGYPCPRPFIKITKTKTQAAYSQLIEILFAGNKFPIGIEPDNYQTDVPNVATLVDEAMPDPIDPYGYEGDGNDIAPGDTWTTRVRDAYSKMKKKVLGIPSPDKQGLPQISPAEEAAKEAEHLIICQLHNSNAEFALRAAALECVMLGTGIIKGPFNAMEKKHSWEAMGNNVSSYSSEDVLIPRVTHTSFWNAYPDPGARKIEDAEFMIERHQLTRAQIRNLKNLPNFREEALVELMAEDPVIEENEIWESALQDNTNNPSRGRYDVLEFWGYLDKEMADALEVIYTQDDVILGQVMVNGWTSHDKILKLVVNPFEPQRIPYFFFPYEEHPMQIWGIGVPENMSDAQKIMNGHMRMAVENLRLAGNLILEVNENQLKPNSDLTLYPGKVFRKQGGAPGQSIYSISFNDVSQSHLMMLDKARQLSDESTGIPSFSHGSTGVMGTGRTAAGMSMLMSAAALNVKTVVKNVDHYLLEPLGRAMFHWNKQFNIDKFKIKGEVKIVARGTTSLMQKEVLTQRLISLLQAASNQLLAPFLNAPEVLKQIVVNMSLDPDKLVNDPAKAKIYAELLQMTQGMNNANQQGTGQPNQAPTGTEGQPMPPNAPGGAGPTGFAGLGVGGIGSGNVPQAGEPTFTGTPQNI